MIRYVYIPDGSCGPSHLGEFESPEAALAYAESGRAGDFSPSELNSIQPEY